MKNLKTQLRLASLLSLILWAWTAAYGQLTPIGDSYTNSAAATTNYGAKTLLDVESSQTAFIQFDLSSIPTGYTGADITKATLKLYVNAVTTAGSFNVDYVNGTWKESTIDYSNHPALGTTIAASVPLVTADKNQYILIDITPAVQAWLNGSQPNDGIALVGNSPLVANFDSKESTTTSHPPELDIVFAGTLTGVTTASGSGLIGGGTSGTLNLSLTNACATNQVLEWNGTAWACANPKGTGTITGVTAGTDLTGGGTSGTVTLSLNTTATNALYAQLGAANTFTTSQTVNGTVVATAVGNGVAGIATGTTGNMIGVLGRSASSSGNGVYGIGATGVAGMSTSSSGPGGSFAGYSAPTGSYLDGTAGVVGTGGNGDPNYPGPAGAGVEGYGGAAGANPAEYGTNGAGGSFVGSNSAIGVGGDGIDAYAGNGAAGLFVGNIWVTGTIYGGTKDFQIDHPMDPANKYLVHASVESSEMMNIYTGNITTDSQGQATVQLPEWFEVLNTDFRYQLTVIGQFAQAIVGRKIENNQFEIRTSAPNVEVSWQVTGVRQDAYAKANPLVVEQEKDARLRGFYIHPELYGAPPEKQIEWARHPEMMKRIQEVRAKQQAAIKAAAQPVAAQPKLSAVGR